RASLRDFFHAQIGQKRFLQVFPFCCFFFSMLSSATIIMNVLHSSTSSNIFSETRFSDTSFSLKSASTPFLRFFFVDLSIMSCFFFICALCLLFQFNNFTSRCLCSLYLTLSYTTIN